MRHILTPMELRPKLSLIQFISILRNLNGLTRLEIACETPQRSFAIRAGVRIGISTHEEAKEVGKMADGVIVGSACVKTIGE